jgi:3-methylcrotonyl-CoA carboxylase beta subunit
VLTTLENDKRARAGKAPLTAEQAAAMKQPHIDNYEREGHPYFASARCVARMHVFAWE